MDAEYIVAYLASAGEPEMADAVLAMHQRLEAFADGTDRAAFDALRKAAEDLSAECDAKQAQIDELMLEYCPDEMTPEQIAEYERHVRAVDDDASSNAAVSGRREAGDESAAGIPSA